MGVLRINVERIAHSSLERLADVTRVIAHNARRLVNFTDSIATLTAQVAQARKRGYAVTGRLR